MKRYSASLRARCVPTKLHRDFRLIFRVRKRSTLRLNLDIRYWLSDKFETNDKSMEWNISVCGLSGRGDVVSKSIVLRLGSGVPEKSCTFSFCHNGSSHMVGENSL